MPGIAQKTAVKEKPIHQKKNDLEYQRDKDREKVKGIFRFFEVPNGEVSFVYKAYKGDQVEKYTLADGQVYTLPLGVAKHLNKNGWYPIHTYEVDEANKSTMRIGKKIRRFGFQSLEFTDETDFLTEPSQIVTAQKVL